MAGSPFEPYGGYWLDPETPYAQRTPFELAHEAERWSPGRWREDEPDGAYPGELRWSFDPAFPLALIEGDCVYWTQWLRYENRMGEKCDGEEDRYDYLRVNWEQEAPRHPIVVVEGRGDGRWHVWDGHHRLASAHTLGKVVIPALVGRRR